MALRPSICAQCQIHLQFSRLFHSSAQLARSYQGGNTGPALPRYPRIIKPGTHVGRRPLKFSNEKKPQWQDVVQRRVMPVGPEEWKRAILEHLIGWDNRYPIQTFLSTLGLRKSLPKSAILRFQEAVRENLKGDALLDEEKWHWKRIRADTNLSLDHALDRILMRQFLRLMPTLEPEQCAFLEAVEDSLQLGHPAEWHPMARQVHRKIILHVGPTNSGKTYHALRALAGAKYGCYAGPLRLLATEVWARLNHGEIAPLGADPTKKHPRVCNLFTGENIKILDEDAGLMSATVEMVPLTKKFDVVVIDEIQMLSHPERGSAWTQALVGLNAEEIHLCGEESAVDLVKELVRPAGDEVIVNRYKRLTPLQIAPRSIDSDLTTIQPGDCIIAFSRNHIFGLKHLVEEKTGLRCAVAYGKLPPEVRVEQATKFNSTEEYPVLVASDAIGMGLNLKIKRVIFSTVSKWDGYKNVTLPLSEIKQIAGRAGRYGMHGADSVGIATTFLANDYKVLSKAFKTAVPDLTTAILAADSTILSRIHRALPPQAGLMEIFQLLTDLGTCETPFALTDYAKLQDAAIIVDAQCPKLSIATRSILVQCPVPWQIPEATAMFEKMLRAYVAGERVDAEKIFKQEGLMLILEDVAAAQEEHASKKKAQSSVAQSNEEEDESVLTVKEASTRLEALELLHRMACSYIWMSYRFPISFSMRDRTEEIKLAAEVGIQFCLEMLQTDRAKFMHQRLLRAAEQDKRKDALMGAAELIPAEAFV